MLHSFSARGICSQSVKNARRYCIEAVIVCPVADRVVCVTDMAHFEYRLGRAPIGSVNYVCTSTVEFMRVVCHMLYQCKCMDGFF